MRTITELLKIVREHPKLGSGIGFTTGVMHTRKDITWKEYIMIQEFYRETANKWPFPIYYAPNPKSTSLPMYHFPYGNKKERQQFIDFLIKGIEP